MILDNVGVSFNTRDLNADIAVTETFFNLTPYIRSIEVERGKTARFSSFNAGRFTITLNNQDRRFDPTYNNDFQDFLPTQGLSPKWNPSNYVGKRRVISIGRTPTAFGVPASGRIFTGVVTDWSFTYTPDGFSVAVMSGYDAFSILNGTTTDEEIRPEELSGARLKYLLQEYRPKRLLSSTAAIDDGTVTLAAQTIDAETDVLTYFNKIAETENGYLFVNRLGQLEFRDKNHPVPDPFTIFGPDGIEFRTIETDFGTELLYNRIKVQNNGGALVEAENTSSVTDYGVKELSLTNLLGKDDATATDLATRLLLKYSEPNYRIVGLSISLPKFDQPSGVSAIQTQLLELELGDPTRIKFTPSGIGDDLIQVATITRLNHSITPSSWDITIGLTDEAGIPLVLDSSLFGRLDEGNVLGEEVNAWTLNDPIYGRLSAGMVLS